MRNRCWSGRGRTRGRADRRGDLPRPNRGDDPEAGELRHQAHALRPGQSRPRHRRGSAVDQGGAGILCQGIRRPVDRRGGFVRPAGRPASAEADDAGQPRRHPARRPAGLEGPMARRQRPLRLDPLADVRREDRRPGRQRRRLRHGRLDGTGPGHVEASLRRHARLPRRPGRGARPARRHALGREGQARRPEDRGDDHQRHRRQHPGGQRDQGQPPASASSPRGCRPTRPRPRPGLDARSAARTTDPLASSPVTSRRPASFTSTTSR